MTDDRDQKILEIVASNDWLTLREICRLARVSRSTISRLVAAKRLTVFRPSPHKVYYSRQSLLEHLSSRISRRETATAETAPRC